MVQIDKGIQIPERHTTARWRELAKKMKPGDSVFSDTRSSSTVLSNWLRKLYGNGSSTTRSVEGGYRVWKLK